MKSFIISISLLLFASVHGQSDVIQSKQKSFTFFGCEDAASADDKCSVDKLRKYFSVNFNMDELYHDDGYKKRVTLFFEIDATGTFKILKVTNLNHPNDEATISKARVEFEKIAAKLNTLTASKKGLLPALDAAGNPTVYKQMLPMNFPSEQLTPEQISEKILAFEIKSKEKALFAWKNDETHYFLVSQSTSSENIKLFELDALSKNEKLIKDYSNLASMEQDYPGKTGLLQTASYTISFGFLNENLFEIRKKPAVNFEVVNTVTKSNAYYENLISLYHSPYKDIVLRN